MSAGKIGTITLGKTHFNGDKLAEMTEEQAVALLTSPHVHADRVKNAWKQANKFKSPNRKRQESVTTAIIEPKPAKVVEPRKAKKKK